VGRVYILNGKKLEVIDGTSYAAPLVTGFAACVLQLDPTLKPYELMDTIQKVSSLYPYYDNLTFDFLEWGEESFWVRANVAVNVIELLKIDKQTYDITVYDVIELGIQLREFVFNADNEKIVYNNSPIFFDADVGDEFRESGAKVDLIICDLKTKVSQQILGSSAEDFKPKWLDKNTLEYNDPDSEERITKQIF
jgi:hypothetical protein